LIQERVEGLKLEVKRLKSQLAANAGQADLLSFLLSNGGKDDVSFVQNLQEQLKYDEGRASIRKPTDLTIHRSAQEKLDVMDATIASLNTEHPDLATHMRNEVSVRQEAAALRSEVERYRRTFGSELNADAEHLAARLRESEATREQLLLLQKQESAVSRRPALLRMANDRNMAYSRQMIYLKNCKGCLLLGRFWKSRVKPRLTMPLPGRPNSAACPLRYSEQVALHPSVVLIPFRIESQGRAEILQYHEGT
jgi:hypothetical protein